MCMSSAPSVAAPVIPAAPRVVQQAPEAQAGDQEIAATLDDERRKRARAAAENQTLVTGGQGLVNEASTTGSKTLYGQ